MEEISWEQAKAFGMKEGEKRYAIDAQGVKYIALAPDGKYYLVEGMEDAKKFLQKWGRY